MLLIALLLLGSLVMLIAGAWCVSEGADILGSKYDATIVGGTIESADLTQEYNLSWLAGCLTH